MKYSAQVCVIGVELAEKIELRKLIKDRHDKGIYRAVKNSRKVSETSLVPISKHLFI